MSPESRRSILLIDDNETLLTRLAEALFAALADTDVEIRTWSPLADQNPVEEFESRIDDATVLVVTDYDLTGRGMTGLFGASIVSWCLQRAIPVGDFSRGPTVNLPDEPALFELRVPKGIPEAATYVATMLQGFSALRDALAVEAESLHMRSPAEVLAAALGRPHLEGQLSLYMSRLGASNSSLLDRLRPPTATDQVSNDPEKARLLVYVLGHVLANAVLRYPGPILSARALCAYLATTEAETVTLDAMFTQARYDGPFSSNTHYYWRTDVDAILDRAAASLADQKFTTSGAFHRAVAEASLGRDLAKHGCTRCEGTNGGYLCPLTDRPVCERADCSVAANSWIPAGADVCRIERDYYEEWAPLLGQ
jgi:hypothetical protein